MNETELRALRELSWRRPLTPAEEAQLQSYFTASPEAQKEWDHDLALTHLLVELPPAPVASNFTALVLQAVERDQDQRRPVSFFRRSWWPRVAWTMALLLLTGFGYLQYQHITAQQLERDAAIIVQGMPQDPLLLEDFEAVHRLTQAPAVDEELWAVLYQPSE